MEAAGEEVGVGVVVEGEDEVRGMELVTRSEARGRCFIILGGGGGWVVGLEEEEGELGEGGGWGVGLPASSHAARADGSTGQADEGVSF